MWPLVCLCVAHSQRQLHHLSACYWVRGAWRGRCCVCQLGLALCCAAVCAAAASTCHRAHRRSVSLQSPGARACVCGVSSSGSQSLNELVCRWVLLFLCTCCTPWWDGPRSRMLWLHGSTPALLSGADSGTSLQGLRINSWLTQHRTNCAKPHKRVAKAPGMKRPRGVPHTFCPKLWCRLLAPAHERCRRHRPCSSQCPASVHKVAQCASKKALASVVSWVSITSCVGFTGSQGAQQRRHMQ